MSDNPSIYKFVLGLNETEGTLFLDLQPKGERPLRSEESLTSSGLTAQNRKCIISGQEQPCEEKSASSPFQREDLRSSIIVFIRFYFVVSLFEVVFGKELPYSDPGLFETMFAFRKHLLFRFRKSSNLLNHFKDHYQTLIYF